MSAEPPLVRPEFPDFSFAVPDARGSRRSPATGKRSHMSGSWDDVAGSKRMLKASLNSEDLSLLLDSLESSRASPSLSRALRLSPAPSPATSRFLASPSIPRKLSQSLSSLLAFSSSHVGIPFSSAFNGTGTESSPAPLRREGLTSTSSTLPIPTLTATAPVDPTSHLDLSLPPVPAAMGSLVAAPTDCLGNGSSSSITVEQSGHVPAHDYTAIGGGGGAAAAAAHQGFVHPTDLGFYAEHVVLPPTGVAVSPAYGMPVTGDADYGSFVAHKCSVDPSHPWNCKCSQGKDFRAIPGANHQQQQQQHSPSACKENGCALCTTKNFVVSEPTTKQKKHSGPKTYHCTVEDCDKTFITRKEQQNHIARHSSEPRYFCGVNGCNCKYTTKSSLDLHVTRIHGEKKFQCDICEERYSVRGDLNQHMKRKHMKQRRM